MRTFKLLQAYKGKLSILFFMACVRVSERGEEISMMLEDKPLKFFGEENMMIMHFVVNSAIRLLDQTELTGR